MIRRISQKEGNLLKLEYFPVFSFQKDREAKLENVRYNRIF